jgi:hypothetical protein
MTTGSEMAERVRAVTLGLEQHSVRELGEALRTR